MKHHHARLVALTLLGGVSYACRPDDQPTRSVDTRAGERSRADMPAELVAHLDSGNSAYRARAYERARDEYRAALAIDSSATAAWFGVFMAERALGNEDAADEALRHARDLAPGASLIHGEREGS